MSEAMFQLLPVLASLLALIFFSNKHRGRCYSIVIISLLAELTATVNPFTLGAVTFCLGGILLIELLYAAKSAQSTLNPVQNNNQKYYSKWRGRYHQAYHL